MRRQDSAARARGRARSRVRSGPRRSGSVLQRDRPAAVGDSERDPRLRAAATNDRPGAILHRIRMRPRRHRRSRKAFQTVTLWAQTYPRDLNAHGLRGGYSAHGTGRYEDVIQSAERALAIDPDFVFAHASWSRPTCFWTASMRPSGRSSARARGRSSRACARLLHRADGARHQQHRAVGRAIQGIRPTPICCDTHSRWPWLAPDSAREDARARGRRRHRSTRPTRDRGDLRIGGGVGSVVGKSVNGQAACGDGPQDVECTRRQLCHRLRAGPRGETTRSESLANDLERRFPRDTIVRFTYVPTLRALAAVARNEPARAIELLQANVPYERAVPPTAFNFSSAACIPCMSVLTPMPPTDSISRRSPSFRRCSTTGD